MKSSLPNLSRRNLLKSSAALSVSTLMPALLAACGGSTEEDGGAGTIPNEREKRDLHFDLSLAQVREPKLFALQSAHHGARLQAHNAESRGRHRALNPALAGVPDARLTHYLEATDLPAAALQGVLVMGTDPSSGRPVLAGAHVHAPRTALTAVAQRRAAQPAAAGAVGRSAKRNAYGIAQKAVGDLLPDDVNAFSTPWDIATYLVFHHPEVMNLNPDLGADILDRIQSLPCVANDASCTPYLGALAFKVATLISQRGYPTTTPGSWATLVAQTYSDGTPVLDQDGKPVYRYDLDDDIARAASAVVSQIKKNIFDDPLFAGTNWQATTGIASQQAAPAATSVATGIKRMFGKDDNFQVAAQHPAGATVSGIKMKAVEVTDPANRGVRLTVANQELRFHSVFVQYLDANGTVLDVKDPGDLDSPRSKFLQVVGPNNQIMGVPLQGDLVQSTQLDFTVPAAASQAKLYFGSLGLGGDAFSKEAVIGSSLTLALSIGLPTMLLAMGAYAEFKDGISALIKDEKLIGLILHAILDGLENSGSSFAQGIYFSATSKSVEPFITSAAGFAIQALLGVAPTLAWEIGTAIGSFTALVAVPLVGIALKLLGIAADLATIDETVGEVLANPAIMTNTVALTMDTTVSISRDPRDYQFPASATKYRVDAIYDGGAVPRFVEGPVTQGRTEPIDAVLAGVPSGGSVVIKVSLYSDDGCLVGVKQTDPIDNVPATASTIPVEIVELVAPLKAGTQYRHTVKLQYQNNAHVWTQAPAPQQTRANLCQGTDSAVCELGGITVHTATGMAGYSFLAGGQGVGQCGTSGTSGVLNTFQNVFLGQEPDLALKFPTCGFTQPVGIVYDPAGPAVGGRHFFVQPAADGYHVRSVVLDKTTPFDLNQTTSWGRFSSPLDSFVVVPSGFVVGVNRTTHKMEILELPGQAVDQALEPLSVPFASSKAGLGTRAGLLSEPVAVATANGAIFVLEQGNARVQAFDVGGKPVPVFTNGTTAFMPLRDEAGAVYLDLAAEGLGYLYVLSYIDNGSVPANYRLDLYTPNGDFLTRTTGVAAARLAVDLFRNVYTLNYEPVASSPRVEPSVSQWLPATSDACPTTLPNLTSIRQASATCGRLAAGVA